MTRSKEEILDLLDDAEELVNRVNLRLATGHITEEKRERDIAEVSTIMCELRDALKDLGIDILN